MNTKNTENPWQAKLYKIKLVKNLSIYLYQKKERKSTENYNKK